MILRINCPKIGILIILPMTFENQFPGKDFYNRRSAQTPLGHTLYLFAITFFEKKLIAYFTLIHQLQLDGATAF